MKSMGDSSPRHEELDKQTRTLPTIDLPRHRFGEYYFLLKIWDGLTGRQTDRHRYFLSCCATKKQYLIVKVLVLAETVSLVLALALALDLELVLGISG